MDHMIEGTERRHADGRPEYQKGETDLKCQPPPDQAPRHPPAIGRQRPGNREDQNQAQSRPQTRIKHHESGSRVIEWGKLMECLREDGADLADSQGRRVGTPEAAWRCSANEGCPRESGRPDICNPVRDEGPCSSGLGTVPSDRDPHVSRLTCSCASYEPLCLR